MKKTYLQTVVNGCAWCKRFIGVSTHEATQSKEEELLLLSHGICNECNDEIEEEFNLKEEPPKDPEDS